MTETVEEEKLLLNYVHSVRYFDGGSKIPKNCHYTSIDVTSSYMVVGSSVGTAYLYNRKNGQLQKLQCDIPAQSVTSICCLESVDLLIAIGTATGLILLFQVLPANNQQMERYLINNVHQHPITCLKWNQNGVKLFSGDENGIITLTEIDYLKRLSKSVVLYRESHPVVQIDYFNKMLLISTRHRTVVAITDRSLVIQVGQKERKSLGNFGAHFYVVADKSSPQQPVILASRPAFRLWKANCEGTVLETFIFKDQFSPSCQLLQLGRKYNAMSVLNPKPELQFGPIKIYTERYAVTWACSKLMVLAIGEPSMVAKCDDFENIRSVAVSGDEIFVLDGFRRITRIAASPDRVCTPEISREESLVNFKFMPNALKNLESTVTETKFIIKSSIFNKLKSAANGNGNEEVLVKDRDFPSLSPHESLELVNGTHFTLNPVRNDVVTEDIWAPLSETDFNENQEDIEVGDVVYARKLAKKVREKENHQLKTFADKENINLEEETGNKDNNLVMLEILKESREAKERRLAEVLQISELAPSSSSTSTTTVLEALPIVPDSELSKYSPEHLENAHFFTPEPPPVFNSAEENYSRQPSLEYPDIYQKSNASFGSLSYGPPSGSSNITSFQSESGSHSFPFHKPEMIREFEKFAAASSPVLPPPPTSSISVPDQVIKQEEVKVKNERAQTVLHNDTWVEHKPPGLIQSLAVCDTYIVCTDTKDIVHYSLFESLGLEWHHTDYPAKQISISPSGKRVWRIHNNAAYALSEPSVRGPFGITWKEVALDVQQISVHESCVWHVTCEGELFCQTGLKLDQTFIRLTNVPCPSKIASVSCNSSAVLALTMEGEILWRTEINEENLAGSNWLPIKLDYGHIFAATLGNASTIWIVDGAFDIWFLTGFNVKAKSPNNNYKWWQVKISDYIYQSTSALQNLTSTLMESLCTEQLTQMLGRMHTGNACMACSDARGIWFYNPSDHKLLTNQRDIIGHCWNALENVRMSKIRWKIFTASGVYHHYGGIWLWSKSESDMTVLNPTSAIVHHVAPPLLVDEDRILCLNAAPEAVWLLTKSGRIFIRKDITANNAIGSQWVELDLTQITHHRLVHVCCGSNLVWAVDSKGVVLMRIGSLQVPSIRNFPPAWVVVDEDPPSPHPKPMFTKVYVGSQDYIVWAIDNKNNVYVRQGIFHDILIGLEWVLVSGIQAVALAISEETVYALTPAKAIYRRYNITRNNYIGDYWKELPGRALHISVTVDDKLWALGVDHQLMQHSSCEMFGGGKRSKETSRGSGDSSIDDDWEVINYEERKPSSSSN